LNPIRITKAQFKIALFLFKTRYQKAFSQMPKFKRDQTKSPKGAFWGPDFIGPDGKKELATF
jgi:hypothetical protein